MATLREHPLFADLFLAVIHNTFFQHRKIRDFYGTFVVPASKLVQTGPAPFEQKLTHMKERRPIIACLLGKWCVHSRRCWYVCEDLVAAVLTWLLLIGRDFGGFVEDNKSLREWVEEFELAV
jgi:hypothetical protein